MAGLRNEATLALKITLSNSKGVASVKKELEALAKAFQAGTIQKQMDILQKEFAETQKQMRTLTAENKRLQKANDNLAASQKRAVAAAVAQTKAIQQANKATISSASIKRVMASADSVLAKAASQGADFTLRFRTAIIKLQGAMERNIRTGGKASKQVLTYAKQLNTAIKSEQALTRAMTTGIAPLKQKLSLISQLRNAFSEYEHRVDALFRASLRLSMTGMQLQRWGQNIIGGLTDVMDTWESFEYQMVRAAGALEIWHDGINKTEVGYKELSKAIIDTSQALVYFSAEETAEALYFWGSATGQVVTELGHLETALGGVGAMMKAATMTNTGFEATIKGVYSILSQFYNGELEYAEYVTEQLFFTTQKTAAEWMDLVQSFKMLGPVAATAGAEFDEVNLIIGKLSDMGLRGSQAGRGLRQFFIQMVRPSGPARAAYEELFNRPENVDTFGGKSLTDIMFPEGDYIGITAHIQKLAEATLHMESAERLAFLAKVSTANQLPVVTSLVAEARAEIRGMADDFDKFEDAASPAEVFEQNWAGFQTTWGYVVKNVERGVEQIKLSMGIILKDVFTPLMEQLRGLTDQVNRFIETNPELVRLAGTFAAISAAALIAGGVLLTALGALLALGASIYLVWGATQKWHAVIVGTAAALFFMAEAVFENARYIGEALTRAIENFNKAIKNMGVGLDDVNDLFEALTRPAREIAGIVVRLAADIAVLASEFAVWASEVPLIVQALEVLVKILTIIVSAKMVAGVLRLVAGFKALNVALATNMLFGAGFIRRLKVVARTITMLSAANGIFALAKGIRLVGAAVSAALGGPLGIIALGTTLAFIAYETIGPFRDLVDGIVGGFHDASDALDRMVAKFGHGGEAIRDKIIGRLDVSDEIGQATAANQAALDTYEAMMAGEFDDEAPVYEDFLHLPKEQRTGAYLRALDEYRFGPHGSDGAAAIADQAQKDLDKVEDAVAELAQNDVDIILGAYENSDAWQAQFDSEDLFGTFVNNLWDDLESGALQPINDAHRVAQLVNIIGGMARNNPKMTQDEAFEMWQSLTGIDPLFMGLTFSEFMESMVIAGMETVEESVKMDEDVVGALDKALTMTDPTAIAAVLTTRFAALGDLTISDILGSGEFSQYHPLARQVMEWHAEKEAEALEQGSATLDVLKARIKSAAEAVAVDTVMAGIPNLDDITLTIQSLSIEGTQESREKMAALLLEPIVPDGPSFIAAAAEYGLTDVAKLAKELAKSVDSQELKDALSAEAAKAAEEAGTTTAKNWNKQFLESLSGLGEITWKDFKKAMGLDTVKERMERASKLVNRMWSRYAPTPEARQLRRQHTRNVRNARRDRMRQRQAAGDIQGARQQARKGIKEVIPDNFNELGVDQQQWILGLLRPFAKEFPGATRKVLINEGVAEDVADEFLAAIENVEVPADATPDTSNIEGAAEDAAESAVDNVAAGVETLGTDLGTGVNTGIVAGVEAGAATMAANVVGAVTGAIWGHEVNSGRQMYETGKWLGGELASGVKVGVQSTESKGKALAGTAVLMASLSNPETGINGASYGRPIGVAFAQGVEEGISSYAINVSGQFTASVKGESPAKRGPLSQVDKWGKSIGRAWYGGFVSGMTGEGQLDRDISAFTGTDITRTNQNEVVVKLEVTSPDGTVNRQKQADVRRGALEALTAAGLEHYVTVG